MYILTCPQCDHQATVRFVRLGATATCVRCRCQFKVDKQTMVMRDGDGVEPPPPPKPLVFAERAPGAMPAAEAEQAEGPSAIQTPEPVEPVAAGAAVSPAVPIIDEPVAAVAMRSRATRTRSEVLARLKRQRGPSRTVLIASVATTLALIGLIIYLLNDGPSPSPNPAPGPTATPHTPTAPTPVAPTPGPAATPAPSPAATVALPAIPEVAIEPSAAAIWTANQPPSQPMTPAPPPGGEVQLWRTRLEPAGGGRPALLSTMYLADVPGVYAAGQLRVQLLNAQRQAYAEMIAVLPPICPRQGVIHRVVVPPSITRLGPHDDIVAELIADQPDDSTIVLEQDEADFKVFDAAADPMPMQVTLVNPSQSSAAGARIVVELFAAEGWPLGLWHGSLSRTMSPGERVSFLIRVPRPSVAPGRVIVRGYAKKAP